MTKIPAIVDEIIETDYAKNNVGRAFAVDKIKKNFRLYVEKGGLYTVIGKIMVIFRPSKDGVVEFHTVNGGSGEDLTKGLAEFLRKLKGKVKFAVTYYDNPKINDMAKYSPVPAIVDQVDEGQDRMYKMTFDLRS
jgi:hypothetical protein